MSFEAMISARGLGKAYRRYGSEAERVGDLFFRRRRGEPKWALRDLNLEVAPGEAVGIIGLNGSGKSTLLQLICGTLRPSEGCVSVNGRVAALLELGAGFSPDFTGRENARFSAAILGLPAADFEERMAAIEAFAGIGSFIDRPVREYSSGMFARLAFSVAIHVDTDILVVDEILAVGDTAFQQKCLRHMRGFCERGGTLLFVSHDDAAVRALCSRAIWLDEGRIQAEGRTSRICRLYHAAMSKLAGEGDSFSMGGEDEDESVPAGADPRLGGKRDGATHFDPDSFTSPLGGGKITGIALAHGDGRPVAPAHGGQDVVLRIGCKAGRRLERPFICFVLRDKLAQILFGECSAGCEGAPASLEAGEEASGEFRFMLPYLPSNDYVIEALLFEETAAGRVLVARTGEPLVFSVSTSHISHGLANIAMREVRIAREKEAVS